MCIHCCDSLKVHHVCNHKMNCCHQAQSHHRYLLILFTIAIYQAEHGVTDIDETKASLRRIANAQTTSELQEAFAHFSTNINNNEIQQWFNKKWKPELTVSNYMGHYLEEKKFNQSFISIYKRNLCKQF